MIAFFRAIKNIVSGVLAELSDQNAYRRHLAAHGTVHSPDEWRRFPGRALGSQGAPGTVLLNVSWSERPKVLFSTL